MQWEKQINVMEKLIEIQSRMIIKHVNIFIFRLFFFYPLVRASIPRAHLSLCNIISNGWKLSLKRMLSGRTRCQPNISNATNRHAIRVDRARNQSWVRIFCASETSSEWSTICLCGTIAARIKCLHGSRHQLRHATNSDPSLLWKTREVRFQWSHYKWSDQCLTTAVGDAFRISFGTDFRMGLPQSMPMPSHDTHTTFSFVDFVLTNNLVVASCLPRRPPLFSSHNTCDASSCVGDNSHTPCIKMISIE